MGLSRRAYVLAAAGIAGCTTTGEQTSGKSPTESPEPLCNAETYDFVTVEPIVQDVSYDGTWDVTAVLTVDIEYGQPDSGVHGAELAAFDVSKRYAGGTEVGDLVFGDVPDENRRETTIDCEPGDPTFQHGTLEREASVETETFPAWVGVRFRERTLGELNVAAYTGEIPDTNPTAGAYEIRRPPDRLQSAMDARRPKPTSTPSPTDTARASEEDR